MLREIDKQAAHSELVKIFEDVLPAAGVEPANVSGNAG